MGRSGSEQKLTESAIGHPLNRMDTLLEASRTFYIGERRYEFNENDPIFFMDGPISTRAYHNTTDGCHTCGDKWKKASDLQDSHCQFCGNSNCKNCLKKTRPFKPTFVRKGKEPPTEEPVEVKRGSVCKLCDRKFLIKEMVQGSLEKIKIQNSALSTSLSQQQELNGELEKLKSDHATLVREKTDQSNQMEENLVKLRTEEASMDTELATLHNDLETATAKQALIKDKLEDLKKDNALREELVSEKIIKGRDLREQVETATSQCEQLQLDLQAALRMGKQPNNKKKKKSHLSLSQKSAKRNRSFDETEETSGKKEEEEEEE